MFLLPFHAPASIALDFDILGAGSCKNRPESAFPEEGIAAPRTAQNRAAQHIGPKQRSHPGPDREDVRARKKE